LVAAGFSLRNFVNEKRNLKIAAPGDVPANCRIFYKHHKIFAKTKKLVLLTKNGVL